MTIPDDWELAASEVADGTVRVELVNHDIPEEYLELVSGGGAGDESCEDGSGCPE